MAKTVSYSDMKYDDSMLIDVESMPVAAAMLDKLARLKDVRRRQPLDMTDNIAYDHRYLYSDYNLQIGDSCFMIPPEFIMVSSESSTQVINTLRQENSQKMKSGYHKRTILIDLVFNGMSQLNGHAVPGPEGIYYVDGLRSILAQFKCAPFLPVISEFLNGTYGIFTVALQSITISTVNGFPNVMKAQLTLQEVNLVPYLEVPNLMFRYMIDWDLLRFYYQRFLTDSHEYKKLQALPTNKEHNHFRISILNPSVFDTDKMSETNFLDIITDKTVVCEGSSSNFVTYIDSNVDDAVINEFQCSYSNMLANIQMSESECPTLQYMGGMDTIYNITFETKDKEVIKAIEQCQVTNDLITRNNIKYRSLGFVKLESELVEFTGSLFVMIDSVTTNTTPGFPDLYNVQINCVAFDIAQSRREQLNGFMPFPSGTNAANEAIPQSWEGVERKARQDNYAEWKIRTTMEVYPDMFLPTYKEVNDFVEKCIIFRSHNNLGQLPYTKYPLKPSSALFGNNPNNTIAVNTDIFYASEINIEAVEYNIFVDPDFYVFYFNPYGDEDYAYTTSKRETVVKKHTVTITQGNDFFGYGGNLIERMIAVAKSQLDRPYSWGGDGENQWGKRADGLAFDCSGLITYIFKQVGIYSGPKMGATGIFNAMKTGVLKDMFEEVPWSSRQRGDIVLFSNGSGYGHVGIIVAEGEGKDMIHAGGSHDGNQTMGSRRGPNDKVKYGDSANDSRAKTCFRLKSQYLNAGDPQVTTSGTENAERIWSGLKSLGLSDIATAAIMGNMMAECSLNPDLFEKDNNIWSGSKIPYNKGYGLIQWTNTNKEGTGVGRRDKMWNYFNNDRSKYSTIENQIKYLYYECTQGPDSGYYRKFWDKTANATNISDAVSAFLNGIEGLSKGSQYWPGSFKKRTGYAQDFYNRFAGQSSFGDSTPSTEVQPDNVLLQSQFDQICRAVMGTTDGEGAEAQKACAQVIYDRLTDPLKSYGDLPSILYNGDMFTMADESEPLDASVVETCTAVFCDGSKKWPDSVALDLLNADPSDTVSRALYNDRETKWNNVSGGKNLGLVGQHYYWGRQGKGSDTKFTIVPDGTYQSSSTTTTTIETEVIHERYGLTMEHIKYFGEPTIARTAKMDENGSVSFVKNQLNDGIRRYNSSFCDMYQYSARGTLLRAFPAFLFCILDDQSQWYDGRKLWTNYYVYKSVVDIQCHAANDMPIDNATITITNSYHNLDQTQMGLGRYSVMNDSNYDSLFNWKKNLYKMTGLMVGGLKLTSTLIELHQVIYTHARLREGARIHLRIGYGSDPLSLAPLINGHISDITLGDQITMVVTSDGHELISHITSSKEKDTNNGFLGLFGLFDDQESSNIIANIMCERQSWINHLCGAWFEGSEYGIEHFGIFCHETFGGFINKKTQYDILKNLYVANYDRESYVLGALKYFEEGIIEGFLNLIGGDGEKNIVFNQYNMTPWDVCQICTQQVPEYIFKASYHQFDSRIYFGLPFWMEKCRYDTYIRNGSAELYEECKTASQVFYCDSITNIIDNQIRVTSKFTNTNVKVMYTRGGSATTTGLLRSDATIDFAYQKTAIIDSPIVQDALGPDALWEFSRLQRTGVESAVRVGTSNLLYGWQQQYQGGLILNGTPGLKPNDHIMLNDTFANTYGLCFAREVIHSFSTMSGYTTTVVPGMVSFATAQNSGCIEQMQNYLALLNAFAYMTNYKKAIIDSCQQNISIIASLIVLQDKLDEAVMRQRIGHIGGTIGGIAITFAKGYQLYKAFGTAEGLNNIITAAKGAYATFKAVKSAGSVIEGIMTTLNAVKSGAATTGVGILITIGIQLAEIVIMSVFEWIEHQNMVCLMPLWWENYPFVSGVKDGENILLLDSNAVATDENERGSGPIDKEVTRFD